MTFLLILLVVMGGVYLFARANANKIKQNPDPYPLALLQQEPQGEEVTIISEDGAQIRAISSGTGPTVVLAHGFGVTLQEWNVVWDALLAAGYRVITFDQRGHGRSTIGTKGIGSAQMAADYKAVLAHFDVRDAVLVGHSMGGFLSIKFQLMYPEIAAERLKGFVLFASFAGDVLKNAPQNRVQIPLITSGLLQKMLRSETFGWNFGASICGERPSPAIIKAFVDIMKQQNLKPLVPIVQAFAQENYYAQLGEIERPCVIICGEADKTTPPWHSQQLGDKLPQARNVWVPQAGHMVNWEAPQALVEVVQSFETTAVA